MIRTGIENQNGSSQQVARALERHRQIRLTPPFVRGHQPIPGLTITDLRSRWSYRGRPPKFETRDASPVA